MSRSQWMGHAFTRNPLVHARSHFQRGFRGGQLARTGVVLLLLSSPARGAIPSASEFAAFPRWQHLSSAKRDLPVPNGGRNQTSLQIGDLDGNGVNDIIIAERSAGPALVWMRRVQDGWSRHVIDPDRAPIAAGGAVCDVDADGDPDLVFGSSGAGSHVWWWENPAPAGSVEGTWRRRSIVDTQKGQHHDQLAGDFLGQGRMQIVSWFQGGGELSLFIVPDDPRADDPWPVITVATGLKMAEGLAAGDLDGDGQTDIVGGGRWYKHLGGSRFSAHVIDDQQTPGRVQVGDLKRGGLPEVVMVIGEDAGRLKWYECTGDPTETRSWRGTDLLEFDVNHGHSLQVADINGDGHADIFCAEMAQWSRTVDNAQSKAWIFYGDSRGNFTRTEIATGFDFHEAKVADINGDGRLDIVSKPFVWQTPRIDVWLNMGPDTPPEPARTP